MADMQSAMREKDSTRLNAIRLLRAALQRREIDERETLDDEGVLGIIQKMIKQSRDAITQFESGQRNDLVEKELSLILVLQQYLPSHPVRRQSSNPWTLLFQNSAPAGYGTWGKSWGNSRRSFKGVQIWAK